MSNPSNVTPSDIASGEDILKAVGSTRTTIDWRRSLPWWPFLSHIVSLSWRSTNIIFAAIGLLTFHLGLYFIQRMFGLNTANADGSEVLISSWSVYFGLLLPDDSVSLWVQVAVWITVALWSSLVWGFFGGVLVRRDIVELGCRTTIGWSGAIKLVGRRLRSIVEAFGLPLLAALALCMVPVVIGWVGRLGTLGQFVSALVMLPAMLLIIPVLWLLLLSLVGFPLMVAAIVAEKESDAFEGISCAAAYLFQRPFTIALAVTVGGFLLTQIYQILGMFFTSVSELYLSFYAAASGIDVQELALSDAGGATGNLLWVALQTVGLFLSGWAISMFWASASALYLVLRREVDHTDFDEIDLQEIGSPLALPPVEPNEMGVLEVGTLANEPAASSAPQATEQDAT